MSITNEMSRLNAISSRVATATTNIANAIIAKGGTVAQGDGLEDLATDVASIPSGDDSTLKNLIQRNATNIIIPNGTTTLGAYSFYQYTTLNNIIIPNSVQTISSFAFQNCSGIEEIIIPDSVTTLGAYVFANCTSLNNIIFSNNIQTFGDHVFSGCTSLTKLICPNSIRTINSNTIINCTNLRTVVLPENNTGIVVSTFTGSSKLDKLIIIKSNAILTLYDTRAFTGTPFDASGDGGVIYVNSNLISNYENATNWSALNATFRSLLTVTIQGDGSTVSFSITDNPDELFYVLVDDLTLYQNRDYIYSNGTITFTTAPNANSVVKIYYA